MMEAAPLPDSYWVLPGKLLAGPYAGSREVAKAEQRLAALLDTGVRRFINLTQVDEFGSAGPVIPYERILYELAKRRNLDVSYHRLPITEGGVPTPARMRTILFTIYNGVASGEATYLHCRAGHGRTSLVVGCYLVDVGWARETVLDHLGLLRSETTTPLQCPERGPQTQMVQTWGTS
jgi:protein tyrosine/serine phosphatase